jgi:hypothetical protein
MALNRFRADQYAIGSPPAGKAWQWVNEEELMQFVLRGWLPVAAERVPGDCDPYLFQGVPVVALSGSILVERELETTIAAHQAVIDKANENVAAWVAKHGGAVRIITTGPLTARQLYAVNTEQLVRPSEQKDLINAQESKSEGADRLGEGSRGARGESGSEESGDNVDRSGDGAGSGGGSSGDADPSAPSSEPDTNPSE